jgi:hypothetical protein
MRSFGILFLLLISQISFAQNEGMLYLQKVNEANHLYKTKKYLEAAHKYTEAFDLVKKEKVVRSDKYNAACSWNLANKKEEAFILLTELIKEDGYIDIEHLKADRDFISIHEETQWKELMRFLDEKKKQLEDLKRFYTLDYETGLKKPIVYAEEVLLLDGTIVDMIPFRVENLWGFVDKSDPNKQLIEPSFVHVHAVYKEGAVVSKNFPDFDVRTPEGTYGLINREGKYLIPPNYQNIYKEGNIYHAVSFLKKAKTLDGVELPLDEGYGFPDNYKPPACVLNDYYNEKGELLFSEKAIDFTSFQKQEDYAWFRFGNQISIRNRSGELVKQFPMDEVNFDGIHNNLLIYLTEESNEYYSTAYTIEGEEKWRINQPMHFKLSDHLYARASVRASGSSVTFIDSKDHKEYEGFFFESDFSIPEDYWKRSHFRVSPLGDEADGLPHSAMGVINREGDLTFGYRGKRLPPFVNGWMYLDTEDRNSLFINENGDSLLLKDIVLPLYRGIYRGYYAFGQMGFYEDWCIGMNWQPDSKPNFYYFDKEGNKLLELPSDLTFAGHFSDGLAPVIKNEKVGFINKEGAWVVEPIYPMSVIKQEAMRSLTFPEFKGGYAYLAGKGYIDKNGKEFFVEKK